MGCPVGTVKSWRAQGRERLRDRLTRRGITSSQGFVFLAPSTSVPTAVPIALSEATVRGVMGRASSGLISASIDSLVKKALRTMMMKNLRLIAWGCFSVAVLAVGANALPGREPRRFEHGSRLRRSGDPVTRRPR